MRGKNIVDDELKRGLGLSMTELEPLLIVGGDAAEMKFMECCRYLWQADGVELIEPFIEAVFNKLPEKSRCVLFQRMLTIVYLAQDYYNETRTHLGLGKDAPLRQHIERSGTIVTTPILSGLHHRYARI